MSLQFTHMSSTVKNACSAAKNVLKSTKKRKEHNELCFLDY